MGGRTGKCISNLKAEKLMSQPILQYPEFSKEFILTTDASNEGAEAILSQGDR
jgi:hypothetical protein